MADSMVTGNPGGEGIVAHSMIKEERDIQLHVFAFLKRVVVCAADTLNGMMSNRHNTLR